MDCDVAVIGAGIHGAAIAQAAAAAGYTTRLLEQYSQPARGTSSKSSKLVHGGLRYLETGQFALVRECLVERRRLLDNAPQLVRLNDFHIPVYRDTRRSVWTIRLGLALYALLGGGRFHQVAPTRWAELDGLRLDGLRAVFRYADAQTDDAALTRAVLASAESLGTVIHYGTRMNAAHCDNDGCTLFCAAGDGQLELRARVLVNASGAWVNDVAGRIDPRPSTPPVELVQGTHIEIPGRLQHGMFYLEAPQDRRAVFVMPWRDNILLGTTETVYRGNPAAVQPLEAEIDYLLAVYNHYFAEPVHREQVIDAFAGLRVLPQSPAPAFRRSRDTLLHSDAQTCPRVLSVYGGKLTSHRLTAERVIAALEL
jgi:glycerol-3-phosphate dehydrogenase